MTRRNRIPEVVHRIILGGIITPPLGEWTPFRSPMCALAFVQTAFEQYPPLGLDITITVESEEQQGKVVGSLEIVSGTTQMMEDTILALPPTPAQVPTSKPSPTKDMVKGSFAQVCLGSREFFHAFTRYWATCLGNPSSQWSSQFLHALESADVNEVLWIDLVHPSQIHRRKASEMMRQNIGSMMA
jgi:hypothetical protein